MTRDETQILKGVAILLMLFLHLFNKAENVALCNCFLYVGDIPLISYLVRACNPVTFFLILGGFGLYKVYKKGDKHRYTRILKLLVHFWVILIIFVFWGSLIKPQQYPGDWITIIGNVLTVDTSYNAEWWFLFPYICLSLLSPYIFLIFDKINPKLCLIVAFVISILTSYTISRYGESYLYHNLWVYNPFLILHLLFPFVLGAFMAQNDIVNRVTINGLLAGSLIIALICFRCLFQIEAFDTIYAALFIILFLKIKRAKSLDSVLSFLGKHSMNMWLVHSWFCYYLFHDEFYSFKSPVFIYLLLIIVSLACSFVVNSIVRIISINNK